MSKDRSIAVVLSVNADTSPDAVIQPRLKWRASKRGFKRTCPKCANAPLFRAYLKSVEHCASCGEPWSEIRADDGPAWATMLVVGHVVAPLFPFVIFAEGMSDWAAISILCAVALLLSLWTLPRMKGLFIGFIWASGALTS